MVRYQFDPESFGIILIATVRGEGKKRMKVILDTGASYLVIPWHIAESIGYVPSSSKERCTITTGDSSIYAPLITLKSVSILGRSVDNVKAIVHNLPENSRVDGLLGLSFLKHFKLTIDFKEGTMELD